MEWRTSRHFIVSPLVVLLVVCFSSNVLSRHHIRHHRDRFKRQHGANLYLPGSYVTDGGEGPDIGPWTDWSSPSPCSRTCGGGVSSQYRQCQPGYSCQGPTKRHFSCNTQDCPDTGDFRAQQCAEFDNTPFEGVVYHQWVPYTKGPNPCELNCMPRGERFYYRHKKQVVDGTRCNDESVDVCVEGKCQPVGCDMMLGSSAKEDKCRVCGGNGTACNTIVGLLDMQDMQPGYNDVLLIPAGATNIRVEEIAPSNNYLAVRNTSGFYYLNGNWRINFPRTLEFAGSKFHYERYPQGFLAPDKISCLGPTDEALFIVLLYQDTNVGIRYEYSVPKTVQQGSDTETYAWTFDEFTPCSVTCGGGVQYRNVSCAGRRTLEPADRSLCDVNNEPTSTQACGQIPCEPQWVAHSWNNCSKPCGSDGVQTRKVFCEQIITNGVPTVVDEAECKKFGPKPPQEQPCNQDAICANWHVGPWKPCDKLCGDGKEKRQVTCYRKNEEGKIEVLADAYCLEEKPEAERKCNLRPCEGVDWVTTEWSGCETKCGLTNETRKVQCATADGKIFPDSLCEDTPLPELVRECKNVNTSCEYQWYASEWSECSAKCGSGVQTRRVFCSSFTGDGIKFVEDDKCNPAKKYSGIRNCTAEQEECSGEWFGGPFGKCSKECGGGERTRKVVCISNNTVVAPSFCSADDIMFSSEECNTQPCTEDTILPLDVTKPVDESDKETEIELLEPEEDYETIDDEECEDGEWIDADAYEATKPYEELKEASSVQETGITSSGVTEETSETPLSLDELMLSDSTYFTETTSDVTGSGDYESSSNGVTESSASSVSSSSESSSTFEGSGDTESVGSTTETDKISDTASSESVTESSSSESSSLSESVTDTSTSVDSSSETTSDVSSESPTTESSPSSELTSESTTEFTSSSSTESDYSTTIESYSTTSIASSSESDSTVLSLGEADFDLETSTTSESPQSSSTIISVSGSTEISGSTEGISGSTETSGATESSESSEASSSTEASESTEVSGSTEVSETTEVDIWSTTPSSITEESSEVTEEWGSTPITEIFQTEKPKVCRRRKRKDCKKSKYGCCMDKITPAQGPFDKGCPITKTCNETKFGCCEDGVSPAAGKKFFGCPPTHCEETLFGCCPDNRTAATGNDNEGCPPPPPACAKSKFGCCPDNTTEAKGPKQKGCKKEEEEKKKEEEGEITTILPTTTEVLEDCSNSTYGCCPDGKSAAEGEYFKGCDIFKANCSESYYGCCPDGNSSAEGPNYKGCKTPCSESPYGCCEDGVTPAHGYNREGCCLKSPFGCCPDNIAPAQGANLEGCDCHYLPFGCCPDNVTAATGYNNEGCGCQYSTHGCCPDNYTPASGPNYEGCLCHTYQFGCCPDGVTTAKGPHQQGCDCRSTQYGCCTDDRTPSSGPNYEGCTCAASKFGCCPDGVTEAQGNKFEGCDNVPENMQEYCDLDKDRGPCRNYTVWWYFDMAYGGCSRFWYGGCDGNRNRFKTKEECQGVCVEATREDRCKLPKVPGPCEGYYPQWYYDRERKTCTQFIYSGCLGNNNRFETREECQNLCVKDDSADACEQPKEEGPCRGSYPRWYYDKDAGTCYPFTYGGCKGNNNNFLSESACKQKCTQPGRQKDYCSLPRVQGNCTEKQPRWYYDTPQRRCMPFYYSGCNGNRNNFISKEACQTDCPKEVQKDVCQLPAELGDCANYTTRWYFDVLQRDCVQFYYGGCGGNPNNFYTREECLQRCHRQPPLPAVVTYAPVQQPGGEEQTYVTTAPPEQPQPYPQPEQQPPVTGEQVCYLPYDAGSCNDTIPAYFYDINSGRCASFTYSGCGGNANRYTSEEQCERQCGRFRQQDVCSQPLDPGPCTQSYIKYYYDAVTGRCEQFSYGGCEGSGNRFSTIEECETLCVTHEEAKPNQTSSEICRLPVDKGPCEGGYHRRWYFDNERGECIPFIYTGCGGNFNRFRSFQNCLDTCKNLLVATEPPNSIDLGVDEREPHPCQAYFDECATLRCPYGIEAYVDENQCNRCQCHDPCRSVNCPENSQCAIDLNRNRTTSQDPTFIAVCRQTHKEGQCPSLTPSESDCDQECSNDAQCTLDLKCCSNGCGTVCVEPAKPPPEVPAELVTSGPYQPAYTEPPPPLAGYYPPQIDEVEFQPEIEAPIGGSVILKCAVRGNPSPAISWSKEGLLIDGKQARYRIQLDQSLQIITLHKTDAGIYLCTADNKIGEPLKKEIKLEVADSEPYAASVLPQEESPSVITSLGAQAVLNCDAIGFPFPAVTWWKDDRLIPLKTTKFEVRKDYSLLIHSVQISNLGVYTCQAYNGIGKAASWTVTVRATGPYHSTDPKDAQYLKYIVDRPLPPTTTEKPQYPYRPQYPFRPVHVATSQPQIAVSYTEAPPIVEPDNAVRPEPEAAGHKVPPATGVYVHPNCVDNRFFANCELIVRSKYCTHKYYAKFCCRSCTEAGQLPSYGPHLDGGVDKYTALRSNQV